MKQVTRFEMNGDILTLHFRDDSDPNTDSYSINVNWKINIEVQKVICAAIRVVATYLLTENKNLKDIHQDELEYLFQQLLKGPLPPEPPSGY